MNTKNLGIVVVVIGFFMLVYTGFHYVSSQKLIDFGPIQINKARNNSLYLTFAISILVIVGGLIIVKVAGKK